MQLLPNEIICEIINFSELEEMPNLKKVLPDHVDFIINRNYETYFNQAWNYFLIFNEKKFMEILPIKKKYVDKKTNEFLDMFERNEDQIMCEPDLMGQFRETHLDLINFMILHSDNVIIDRFYGYMEYYKSNAISPRHWDQCSIINANFHYAGFFH